jgi:hypothetical protein
MEFGGIRNSLDVMTQYEILGFCELGLNRLKFCRTMGYHVKKEVALKSIQTIPNFLPTLVKAAMAVSSSAVVRAAEI